MSQAAHVLALRTYLLICGTLMGFEATRYCPSSELIGSNVMDIPVTLLPCPLSGPSSIGDACAEVMLLPCLGSEDGKGSFPRKPLEVRLPLQAQVVLARFHVERKIGVTLDGADPFAIYPYAKCRVAHFACSLFENLAYKDHGFTGYGLRNGRA